jgi:chemosensory pili system protein ChpA (sensor histidine kinase/response regulator)
LSVPTETAAEFDLGPLSWVQGEIDQALARGLEALAAFGADPSATSSLAHARNHVHQAAGAILMVGLDAVAAYAEEVERQLARLETVDAADLPAAVTTIERACQKLRIFLDELVNGSPPVPLKLYPEFEQMQQARGVKAVTPTDLFYPDLTPRAPRNMPRDSITPLKLPSFLIKQRRHYQRGLLSWLRGEEKGGKAMREAIAAVEDATPQGNLRAFWWTVDALFEAIVGGGLEPGFGLKQLAARIDLQIRRVAEGGAKVADRLRREVLYYVAISAPVGPQLVAVQSAFKLSGLIPSAAVLDADVVHIKPLLREAREQLAGAKDSWLKAAAGRAENLPKLKQTLASVHTKAVEIKNGALMKLTAALVERLDKLPAAGVSEPLAMEYATALLLAESAFENYSNLAPDFPRQVNAMLARLDAARAGRAIGTGAPMLDEMSKRAQERVLLAQVGREIRANLRHMEQVLDAFFRDNTKRAELASLAKDSQQIRGALQVLGLSDADRLLAMCQEQIERYATSEIPVADDDLELLAESLSGLGFFVEAVEQQRPDRERLIAPLIARRMGEAPLSAAPETDSVERAVATLRAQLPELVAEMHRAPSDAVVRDALLRELTGLRDDAELIGDVDLIAQADAALKEFKAGGAEKLAAAIDAIADSGVAPAPEISAETQRLLASDTTKLDAELLDIYLTEAAEVLDTVAEHHRVLSLNPGDREALAIVRRQFHTLKGSGRMVGLTELGELAWQVEQVGNRLIEEERPVTQAVLTMIDVAEKSFRGWVDELSHAHRIASDAHALLAAIHAVQRQWPGGAKIPPPVRNESKADVAVPASPPHMAEIIELPELGIAGHDDAPAVVVEDTPPAEEMIDVVVPQENRITPPVLKLVADNTAVVASLPEIDTPAAVAASEAPEVTIGAATLSTTLWNVLCDEAEAHVATLSHELSLLQFDPRLHPSAEMVRASHTLCGIHRTGGFPPIASTANALEQTLIALAQRGAPLPTIAQPVLAHAIDGIAHFVGRVRARAEFSVADLAEVGDIQRELEALRRDAVGAAAVDAETAAAEVAQRDEETPAEVPVAAPILLAPPEMPTVDALPPAEPTELTLVDVAPTPEATPAPTPAPMLAAPDLAEIHLPVAIENPLAGIRDDVDTQVLAIFLEEAAELYPQAGEQVRGWRRSPSDTHVAQHLRRTLHTFKGSARMAGAMRLGELTHLMESRLLHGDSPVAATPDLFEALDTDLDHIAFVLDALREGRTNVELPEFAPLPARVEPSAPIAAVAGASIDATPVVAPLAPSAPPAAVPAQASAEAVDVEAQTHAMLRVRADIVDRLVNEAGEVAIARARIEGELRSIKSNLLELTNSVIRLRNQVREIELQAETQIQSRMSAASVHHEFDPLELDRFTRFQELTRSLAEGVNDVSTVQQALLRNLDDADAALLAQARLSRDVQQRLFAIRTVPFGSLSERLYRILRGTAKELDKRANLEINGGQTELDRSVLEKLVGPLEHLLRNALDHGLEARAERVQAGKPETGEISLTVRQIGNEVVIELADDGAGIDYANVRNRARSLGLIAPDAEPTEPQLIECLFQPGFSTASKVTQISGRGIGMDVVRAEIAALGGRVEVRSTPGKGTQFNLFFPLTLAVAQAVLVRAGGRLWALPAPMVEQVQQIKGETLVDLYVSRKVDWQGRVYPFHYLPRLLGDTQHKPETQRFNAVLLLKSGQGLTAVHVDEMIGNQEVVVKNIGPQLARVSGVSGATVLGTGEIVLIINPVQLAMRPDVTRVESVAAEERVIGDRPGAAVHAGARNGVPLIMIVDDSLTVRKVTSRMLLREGFDVVTAKDGVDALQVLGEQMPDVILLDIEMPRMDGFEFTKTMKGDPECAHIPIIMITSRTAEKHRNRAAELGVDLYLGKPYQEDDLLRNLRDMLSLPTPA